MRTRGEILAAIKPIEAVGLYALHNQDVDTAQRLAVIADVLRWCLGEPSEFTAVVDGCNAIDRAERQ